MSGRVTTPPPNGRPSRPVKFFLALGLVTAGLAGAAAQNPPEPPDATPPLPPGEPARALVAAKYQVPNRDRAIFQGRRDANGGRAPNSGIVDYQPFAPERDNKDEYDAWNEVVEHAARFPAAELEANAARDLIRKDLERLPARFRLDLVRFDGKVTRVRRVPATKGLRETGIAEVYEASLAPLEEPPNAAVSVAFTDLPPAFAAVKQTPEAQWVPVEVWASAAGFFFKLAPGDAGDAGPVPVLVGRSVTVLPGPPPGPDKNNPAALDKTLRVFKFVRDDAAIGKEEDNWEEAAAWNRVLLHARRFPPEELEANARTDVTFYDLFKDARRDYKLDLVKFEGRLIALKKMEPTRTLRDAGVAAAYEGWLVPRDEPSGHPLSVVFTDPPEGVEPAKRVNKWVSFAGYSFKLIRFESGEQDRNDPKKNVWKKAPLLLGRAVIARPDPEGTSSVSWQSFATTATVAVLGLIGTALGLSWWFRRGDRRARREVEANRPANPFGGA